MDIKGQSDNLQDHIKIIVEERLKTFFFSYSLTIKHFNHFAQCSAPLLCKQYSVCLWVQQQNQKCKLQERSSQG